MSSTTTPIAHTGRSGCSRRIPLSDLPSVARISWPKSTGATCSADSCTSTEELHERICAPYGPRRRGFPSTALGQLFAHGVVVAIYQCNQGVPYPAGTLRSWLGRDARSVNEALRLSYRRTPAKCSRIIRVLVSWV